MNKIAKIEYALLGGFIAFVSTYLIWFVILDGLFIRSGISNELIALVLNIVFIMVCLKVSFSWRRSTLEFLAKSNGHFKSLLEVIKKGESLKEESN